MDVGNQVLISIHAPRTGSDPDARTLGRRERPFQPTLPARGATQISPPDESRSRFQPTLPARGATSARNQRTPTGAISTHAPRTGSDRKGQENDRHTTDFNPRSPHGERRQSPPEPPEPPAISTHAPRTGSDQRLPCKTARFLCISTHAPRTGSDSFCDFSPAQARNFNPRSPHGERRPDSRPRCPDPPISTHAPRTGSDMPGAMPSR